GADIPSEFNLDDPSRMIVKIVGEGIEDRFGSTLAVLPDITGDGKPELAVSAIWASGGQSGNVKGAGKVYLFNSENLFGNAGTNRNASTAEQKFSAAGNGSEFGTALRAGDGLLFIGAPFSDGRSGQSYIFDARTGGSTQFVLR
ncbi:hypothetical protein MNBD_GAMMA24-1328, partial [hydrothermal vent metagenome]